ncbi:Uncharacterised protein [Mycobacterium tuberculosis]|nr:Uncharacterised protein [Mycobacterium tuberculosis]
MGTPESWIIHDTGVLRAAAAASLLVVCYWLRRSSTRSLDRSVMVSAGK